MFSLAIKGTGSPVAQRFRGKHQQQHRIEREEPRQEEREQVPQDKALEQEDEHAAVAANLAGARGASFSEPQLHSAIAYLKRNYQSTLSRITYSAISSPAEVCGAPVSLCHDESQTGACINTTTTPSAVSLRSLTT